MSCLRYRFGPTCRAASPIPNIVQPRQIKRFKYMNMKAVVFDKFGEPGQVLRLAEVPVPEPGPGQVRVKMIASPVNPSDLLVVRGRYGVLPVLPATPGFEGVGVVDAVGPGANLLGRLVRGKRVCVINSAGGNWAEYAVIPSRQARPVPADLPDEQVAAFFVNPCTVLAMVRHVLRVPKGAWLLQSAAGSELGKMVIRLGKHDGFRTINLVRREESAAELKALGADAVVCTADGSIRDQVRAIVGKEGVRFGLDPVGGETGTAMLGTLADEGLLLVYGSLSEKPIAVESRQLIARRIVVRGFWLGHFMRSQSIPSSLALFREVGRLIRAGVLSSTIGKSFGIDAIHDAARAAEAAGRSGKTLLRLT